MNLGFGRDHAMDIFEYAQRVLSINVSAGEKSIPEAIRSMFPPNPVDSTKERELLEHVDSKLRSSYSFTPEELDFIINYDIKYRRGKEGEEESG